MRKILFRGKRLDNGEWVYGDLIKNQGRCFVYHATSETTIKDNDDNKISVVAVAVDLDTVGQFTGLPDKDSEQIFEGDILMYDYYSRPIIEMVSFRDGRFVTICQNHPDSDCSLIMNAKKATVIGNIHDNPELCQLPR